MGPGDDAAWAPVLLETTCTLAVRDSNATFEVRFSDDNLTENAANTCREKSSEIARSFYAAAQAR